MASEESVVASVILICKTSFFLEMIVDFVPSRLVERSPPSVKFELSTRINLKISPTLTL